MGYTEKQAKDFISQIAPLMVAEGIKRGYKVISTAIAQAIIESASNTSVLGYKYANYFGMKCGSSWSGGSVNLKTKEEYTKGILTTIKDNFRTYLDANGQPDMAKGVAGYYDFISTKRYANLKTAKNYIEYANMLKIDGYATSSTYINTLCSTVNKYDLTKYDNAETVVKASYQIGKTYTTTSDLYIRDNANGNKVKFECITLDAKAHSKFDDIGYAILKKGTRVTCKNFVILENSVWLQIPSGWICAENKNVSYING